MEYYLQDRHQECKNGDKEIKEMEDYSLQIY